MATLSEVLIWLQVPAGFGAFLLAVRLAPYIVDRTRATVRGLEGLILDCESFARTMRRVLKRRRRK